MKSSSRDIIRSLTGYIVESIKRARERNAGPPAVPPHLVQSLAEIGVEPSAGVAESFFAVAARLCADEPAEERFADLVLACLDSPSPAAALTNLRRFLDSLGNADIFLGTVSQAPPVVELLTSIFGSSQYLADIVIRNPGYLYWLMEQRTWESQDTAEDFAAALRDEAMVFRSPEGRLNAIRRAQRKMLLKIGVRDLLGEATIEETTRKLSNLAEAIAGVTLDVVAADQHPENDAAGAGIAVIALGKLGGMELNYSSDIDILYVCSDADESTTADYRKLARAHVAALSEITAEGYLYRVDLRLRPDGDAGPLVNSETSMRIYYENRGRPWEFQAMLKARVVAGNRALGDRVLGAILKLVFSPSLSYTPLEDIGRMRVQISELLPARERALNIKLMSGGIRDIEFTVQTFQLLKGDKTPTLRTPNTLEALEQIRRLKLLKKWEVGNLASAYRFFRLVEHRLQMMHQIKTHTVPDSREEIALLARRVSRGPLGRYDTDEFLDELSRHLNNVRTFSDSFFAGEEVHPHSVLLMLPDDDDRADSIIRQYGIEDVKQAVRLLHSMAYGSFPRLHDRGTRAAFEALLPLLLEEAAGMGDPGLTLVDFALIAEASRSESSFYRFLAENKPVLRRLVAVAGFSSYLTKRLCNHMEILEPVFVEPLNAFRTTLDGAPRSECFDPELAARDDRTAAQRRDRQRARLDRARIGGFLLDAIEGQLPSRLPDAVKVAVYSMVGDAFEYTFSPDEKMALFALGSFASGEPRLFSDLDLIVVTDGADIPDITKRVQLINRWFTDGNIVKLDFRLRGEGASAPLVQDIGFYESYFENRMSPWEKVAFAKNAYWWGSPPVAERFMASLRAVLERPFTNGEIDSLKQTRKSIESLAKKTQAVWETKRSPGGRYDIEYMTAIGLAGSASNYAGGFARNSGERLKALHANGLLSSEELSELLAALDLFSTVEYLMELQEWSLPQSKEKSKRLENYLNRACEYLGKPYPNGVANALGAAKRFVRNCYERLLSCF